MPELGEWLDGARRHFYAHRELAIYCWTTWN